MAMKFNRLGYKFEIPECWMTEIKFVPIQITGSHYTPIRNVPFVVIDIQDIDPQIRGKGTPIFNDGEVNLQIKSAKERTQSILRAIRDKEALPPIEVVKVESIYKYKLYHGAHRLHCSVAAGFTKIPAVLRDIEY